MTNQETQVIKVIEIRACQNGFVISVFRREADVFRDRDASYSIFESYVAIDAVHLSQLVKMLAESKQWNLETVGIPPARGEIKAEAGKERDR